MSLPPSIKPLLVANWKMNLGVAESVALAKVIGNAYENSSKYSLWLAASFPAIAASAQAIDGTGIWAGAQNIHWANQGAFTGEVSGPMLCEIGAKFAIVGHSERRHVFLEDDAMVARRAAAGLANKLAVIYCVGETLAQREKGKTLEVLSEQLKPINNLLGQITSENFVLAYEPVWAIGTGKVASLNDIVEAHQHIRKTINSLTKNAPLIRILYGGSVAPDNFSDMYSIEEVDGALVGGASLSIEKFSKLMTVLA